MTVETRVRRVRIEALDLRLSGASPGVARQVTALLPEAIRRELGRGAVPEGGTLRVRDGRAGALAGRLAREIAGRVADRLDREDR